MTEISAIFSDAARSGGVSEQFALVYTPQRRRNRFPDNCVHIVADAEAALAGGNPQKHLYPAKVFGPSRSSEGILLYYLIRWLDQVG
jgi:hypothetical protein